MSMWYRNEKLNRDDKLRFQILNLEYKEDYDLVAFFDASLEQVEKLFENNFVDPDETQNGGETAENILEFMRKYPFVHAEGYLITPERSDYRITFDGLVAHSKDAEFRKVFRENFLDESSEYTNRNGYQRVWWD